MFYAAQALLLGRGIRRSKHAGVLAAFNEEFVRPGLLSSDLFLKFRDGFEDRAEGDYGLAIISDEQARAALTSAGDFVDAIARHIGSHGPPTPEA